MASGRVPITIRMKGLGGRCVDKKFPFGVYIHLVVGCCEVGRYNKEYDHETSKAMIIIPYLIISWLMDQSTLMVLPIDRWRQSRYSYHIFFIESDSSNHNPLIDCHIYNQIRETTLQFNSITFSNNYKITIPQFFPFEYSNTTQLPRKEKTLSIIQIKQ